MTDVLGHDCCGRPLRAGDEVVLISSDIPADPDVGKSCIVIRQCPINPSQVEISIPHYSNKYNWWSASPNWLRKLTDDHRSAGSFEEVMAVLGAAKNIVKV